MQGFMYNAHCSLRLHVPELVLCIPGNQYDLKNCGVLTWDHCSFCAMNIYLPVCQPLLGVCEIMNVLLIFFNFCYYVNKDTNVMYLLRTGDHIKSVPLQPRGAQRVPGS